MNKHILLGILILCLAGGLLAFMLGDQKIKNSDTGIVENTSDFTESQKLSPTEISQKSHVFKNSSNGVVQVFFDTENETATVNADGHGDVVFTQVVSASGARYENKNLNMVLWNKGDSITLYQGEKVVFEGTKQ